MATQKESPKNEKKHDDKQCIKMFLWICVESDTNGCPSRRSWRNDRLLAGSLWFCKTCMVVGFPGRGEALDGVSEGEDRDKVTSIQSTFRGLADDTAHEDDLSPKKKLQGVVRHFTDEFFRHVTDSIHTGDLVDDESESDDGDDDRINRFDSSRL